MIALIYSVQFRARNYYLLAVNNNESPVSQCRKLCYEYGRAVDDPAAYLQASGRPWITNHTMSMQGNNEVVLVLILSSDHWLVVCKGCKDVTVNLHGHKES